MGYWEAVETLENEPWSEQMGHGGHEFEDYILSLAFSSISQHPQMISLLFYMLLLPSHIPIVMELADNGLRPLKPRA